MSKLRVHISTSLDGYVAGPNQSEENPLGEGGEQLHDWVVELKAWREPHGREGGEENASTQVVEEARADVGAEIMGRGMFGPPGGGPWGDDPWAGWGGERVRPSGRRPGGGRSVGGLVGRCPPLPQAGLRRHAPRARAAHALRHH